jgi:hypothetical protein
MGFFARQKEAAHIEDFLGGADPRHIVVFGPAGIGKTFF